MCAEFTHPASDAARQRLVLGVVGGSGLQSLDVLQDARAISITTPFGTPSGPYLCGAIPRAAAPPLSVVFLARHGPGHTLLPSEINFRANIHGFKQLGVTHLLSVSAVGSLAEELAPGHFCLPDQFFDRTNGRSGTFFGEGAVAHVPFGEPTSPDFREKAGIAARANGATVHDGGVCVVMEGPAFSTRAEADFHRSLGASVIGMTALPEAKLAREAEIAYALLAMVTDYDCWHPQAGEVSVEAVMAVMHANADRARATVLALADLLPAGTADLPYPPAARFSLVTAPDSIPDATRARLDLIIGHIGKAPS
jgi:5'-methylthioadenosine phosphorylase